MSFLAAPSSLSPLLFLCCLSLLLSLALGKTVKITEGVNKLSTDSLSTYTGSMASTETPPYITPEALSGPAALHFLDGHCFEASHERWEYVVCPFQNVTQRRVLGSKTNVLGVWGHWRTASSLAAPVSPASPASTEDPSAAVSSSSLSPTQTQTETHTQTHAQTEKSRVFSTMVFEDGKSCAEDQDPSSSSSTAAAGPFVSSSVELVCDHAGPGVEVLSVDDSAFCAFSFKLGVPIACSLLKLDEGDVKHHRDLVKDLKH